MGGRRRSILVGANSPADSSADFLLGGYGPPTSASGLPPRQLGDLGWDGGLLVIAILMLS